MSGSGRSCSGPGKLSNTPSRRISRTRRGRLGTRRAPSSGSGGVDEADRVARRPRPGQVRDRHLPLPGPARGRPHHTRRPTTARPHRRHLAVGRRHRPRVATDPRRLPPTTRPPDPREPHRPWKARQLSHRSPADADHRIRAGEIVRPYCSQAFAATEAVLTSPSGVCIVYLRNPPRPMRSRPP